MSLRLESDYQYNLVRLDGYSFQNEIEKLANDTFIDFQAVVSDSGDGGVDGLCRGNSVLICCYGLALYKAEYSRAQIITKLKKKFRDDLLRILELNIVGKGKKQIYEHKENKKIKEILGSKKLKVIMLIANTDENSLIGYFTELFTELKRHSQCRYVEVDCHVVFHGPTKICQLFDVTDKAISRLKNKQIYDLLETCREDVRAGEGVPKDLADFNNKFEFLAEEKPERSDVIHEMHKDSLSDWCNYIIFMQRLKKECPSIYDKISEENTKIIKELKKREIFDELTQSQKTDFIQSKLEEKWKDMLGVIPLESLESLIKMNMGHLIGTCPIDWRGKKSA